MKSITFSYVVYEKDRKKDNSIPVKFRITFGKSSTLVSSGVCVGDDDLMPARKCDARKTRTIKNPVKRRIIEDRLRALEDEARTLNPMLLPDDTTVTDVCNMLKRSLSNRNFHLDFVSFCREFISSKKKSSSQAALNYQAALLHLCEFWQNKKVTNQKREQEEKKQTDKNPKKKRNNDKTSKLQPLPSIDISFITSSFMRQFEVALRLAFGDNARAVSMYTSAIGSMHKAARMKYNSEETGEALIKNPFEYYHPPKQPSSKHRNVSKEIIQGMINNYPFLNGREKLAVGAFLLSFACMGMNAPDMYKCGFAKGHKDVLEYDRTKVMARRDDHAHMEVKMSSYAAPLFKEYADRSPKDKQRVFNFHIRYSSVTTFEDAIWDGLKEYRKNYAPLDKFTFYSARHSWATVARSHECNVPMSIIDDCLAHVGSHRIGDIYAKKDYSVLWEANEKVLGTFDWSPIKGL